MERFKSKTVSSQTLKFVDPLSNQLNKESVDDKSILKISDSKKMSRTKNEISKINRYLGTCRSESIFGGNIPYTKEWERICMCSSIKEHREWALNFQLLSCRFRSVCWRVLLNILSDDSTKWLSEIRSKRESYENLRHNYMVTPGIADQSSDPNLNNPLSQDEQSSWNQYFEDSELKRIIKMDVTRTFPEVEFFQTLRIQEMMVSILFCYARKYPQMCYIQGMHEILAPLIYVLNYDYQVHKNSQVDTNSKNLLQELMDETYLEHDSFTLFETVMEKLNPWYDDGDPKMNIIIRTKSINTQPFAKAQDMEPTTKIVKRLTAIHEHLLRKHEAQIFAHLNKLEIAPQLFGIRWARLMFGREFTFPDLLVVWDSIFADSSSTFHLIDYLIVALLSNIKDKLLASDYVESMKYLMRYPPSSNVQTIIQLALHFRSPQVFPYPTLYCIPSAPTVGGQHNVHRGVQSTHQSIARSASLPRHNIGANSGFKHRSTSAEQKTRYGDGEAQSPHLEQSFDSSRAAAFKTEKNSCDSDPSIQEDIFNSTNKPGSDNSKGSVVSGLARLGGKLARPKEISISKDRISESDKPMDELKYMEKSAPIPTSKFLNVEANIQSTSSEEDQDPTFPQKKISGSLQRLVVEDVLSVSLGCALRLSHHQANLATRLAQLNIENDLTLRTAMDGIAEVVDTLKEIKEKPRKSPNKSKSPVESRARSLPAQHSNFTHPLMTADDNDEEF